MSIKLTPFVFDGRELRTIIIDGMPWVVASDVCDILGLGNTTDALKGTRKDRLAFSEVIDSVGRKHRVKIINESGLYRLILRSNKPDAERFQDWICDDVLPQIRKTGKFQVDVRGWLSNGPKAWRKTFPDSFYQKILELHGKDPNRLREQEPWLAQLTTALIYGRIDQGIVEALSRVNPVPEGKRWRPRKLHQHIATGEAEKQFTQLIGECVGVLCGAKTWEGFLSVWDTMHPLVAPLPTGVEATLSDGQLWLFDLILPKQQGA